MADTTISVAQSTASLGIGFNVKDYGAFGDAVVSGGLLVSGHDDTKAIANAAAAANAVNGTLIFPPGVTGVYWVTAQPVMSNHSAVVFDGSILVLNGTESVLASPGMQFEQFRGVGYFLKQLYVGQSAGFVTIPSPAPGVGLGDAYSILVGAGNTVHITDNSWKEGLHLANVAYKTSSPFTTGAVEGVEGEARVGALNTQNWTGYLGNVACIGVTGTVVTENGSSGTISCIANFYAQTQFSATGAAVTLWTGFYVPAPIITETGTNPVVHYHGIHIEALTGATGDNFSIWSGGGVAYIQDGIGIGTTTPSLVFDVEKAVVPTLPAASGTVQSSGGRIRIGSGTSGSAVLDMGLAGGTGAWLQSVSATNLANNLPLIFNPNGGDIIHGLATVGGTTDTTGYVYITTCSGTPTGVPANASAGRTAMRYDSSAHKLWVYDQPAGAWKGVLVA